MKNFRSLGLIGVVSVGISGCATTQPVEFRKIASDAPKDPLTRIQESYGIPAGSEVILTEAKIKLLKPPISNQHRTIVPLVQTSQTPSTVEIVLSCVKQKQVCLERQLVPVGGYGHVGTDGYGGSMQFTMSCAEWGYEVVRRRRPAVIHFDVSSRPKGDEKKVYLLFCDDSQGANMVRLRPEYTPDAPYCSGAANKVTQSIQKRFLVKNKTVYAVYNDGKDPCAKSEAEIKEEGEIEKE